MNEISIRKVAELAGVSIATVSRCINNPDRVAESTRLKVNRAIDETGYTPNHLAQSFRRGHTNIIMIVLPSIGDPFFTEVMAGIRSVLDKKRYSVVMHETEFNTVTAHDIGAKLVSRQVDGVVLLASVFPFGHQLLASVRRRGHPIVIGCEVISPELEAFPSVHIDDMAAAEEATQYLISQEHRRIAFITGQVSSLLTRDRERGYREAMGKAGLTIEPGWVIEGNMTLEGAVAATRQLLRHDRRPTAIFCANDEMAIGCLHAAKEMGFSVPAQLSVVGFDDVRYAAMMDPPLTTIAQPAREIGERAAQRMLEAIEQGPEHSAETEIVPHRLVIRKSVAPPRE